MALPSYKYTDASLGKIPYLIMVPPGPNMNIEYIKIKIK